MATSPRTEIRFPVGRLVMGSLYKARDKDAEGKPLVIKTGPDAGKARVDFFIAVAIPKEPGHTHWAQTQWGQLIYQAGAAAFPNAYQAPTFAWKIDDGDSQIPNRRGNRPCDNEGWPGHWIVKLSGGYAPKVYSQPSAGTFVELTTPDAVKPGYWVQAAGNVSGNGSAQQPGIYLNHSGVLFIREDKVIVMGPDAATMFAGAAVSAALPGGAPAMPFAAPGAPAALPGVPVAYPGAPGPAAMPAAPVAAPVMPAAPVMVAPNPAFLAIPVPGAPALPPQPAMPAPPVPAEPVLTPAGAATGHSYAQFRSAGWSDLQMRQAGYIV